jgi:hypothetical protein
MRLPLSRRAVCVLTALLTAFVVCPLAGAQAAKAPRPLVAITSPAAGSTGTGINLVVSGTARGATTVAVTIGEDVNTYEVWVVKSKWSTFVNPQPAGSTQICAEARDSSGTALGRSCIAYTVAVDGVYLSLFPEDGSNVQSTFSAVGGCHDGSTVRLTLDGSSIVLPCVTYSFAHEYVAVREGTHTLTADQLALDGTTVVASVTRTFTSSPVPVATIAITAPPDGASGGIPQVTPALRRGRPSRRGRSPSPAPPNRTPRSGCSPQTASRSTVPRRSTAPAPGPSALRRTTCRRRAW